MMTIEFTDEDDTVHRLPTTWSICPRCRGEGKHTNPSIDGNGITSTEWENEWDEDERETYLSGGYDVACEERCQNGKVRVVDEQMADPAVVARYEKHCSDVERENYADMRTRQAEDGYRW